MKILIPTLGFGPWGGQRVLSELANNWIDQGHDVDFLVNQISQKPYFPTKAKIVWINYWGRTINEKDKNKSITKINGWLNLFGLFISLNKIGKKYDVILANNSLTVYSIKYARCAQARKIYYIQAYEPDFYNYNSKLKTKIQKWLSKKSYDIKIKQICNSPIYIGYKNISASSWVPPGINFDLFYKKNNLKNFRNDEEIILGCIGRKEPIKGTIYVIEAFELLYSQNNKYKLHVAYGNLPDNYSHPNVLVIKPQNDSQLANFYRTLDIMIAPGTVQLGAPHYPVMEAMACGIPVVTTGYMPATQLNSWIVDIKSATSIVTEVNNIINDINYRNKVSLASEDVSKFDWSCVSKQMIDIFDV